MEWFESDRDFVNTKNRCAHVCVEKLYGLNRRWWNANWGKVTSIKNGAHFLLFITRAGERWLREGSRFRAAAKQKCLQNKSKNKKKLESEVFVRAKADSWFIGELIKLFISMAEILSCTDRKRMYVCLCVFCMPSGMSQWQKGKTLEITHMYTPFFSVLFFSEGYCVENFFSISRIYLHKIKCLCVDFSNFFFLNFILLNENK